MKPITFAIITVMGLLWLALSATGFEKIKFASAVKLGMTMAVTEIPAQSRGVPTIMVAKLAFQGLGFTKDGKISKNGLENVRRVLIDYGMIKKGKAPPVDKMYTAEFTR